MNPNPRKLCAISAFLFLLLGSSAAPAAILTVGPGGTYPTIQAALDDAVLMPGTDQIRLREGTFSENLFVDLGGSGDTLQISGGWNKSFTSASTSRTTTIDGGALGKVFEIRTAGSDQFIMQGMVLRNGQDTSLAGVAINAVGTSTIKLANLTIRDNLAIDTRTDSAGLYVDLLDAAGLDLDDCDLVANTVSSTGDSDGRGGGLTLRLSGTSRASVLGNRITENVVLVAGVGGLGIGAGADVTMFDSGTQLTMTDNVFRGNRVTATTAIASGLALGGGSWVLRRNVFAENEDDDATAFGPQLLVSTFNGTAFLTDTLVVDGNARGVTLNSGDGGVLRANNLTIANHPDERGLLTVRDGTGVLSVHNTISVSNGINAQLAPGVTEGNNLFFDDPSLFVDAAGGNYRLSAGAAAIDAGDDSPPGGLGPSDLDVRPRISGPAVDIGAFEEADFLFSDDFET